MEPEEIINQASRLRSAGMVTELRKYVADWSNAHSIKEIESVLIAIEEEIKSENLDRKAEDDLRDWRE